MKFFKVLLFAFLFVTSCGGGESESAEQPSGGGTGGGAPELSRFESQMRTYGKKHCDKLDELDPKGEEALAATYYDAEWVFYQIYDYTREPYWKACAKTARKVYRDSYVTPNNGNIPGYWIFTHGLTESALREGDARSKQAELLIAKNAAFARESTLSSETQSVDQSRETAYAIMAFLNAERLGENRRPRLKSLVDQALGHIDQWFVKGNAPFIRPFMVALTAHALISYNEKYPDPRIPPALKMAADKLWKKMWLPAAESFMYTDRGTESGGQEPAPDLNLLIAPLYAWVYKNTGDKLYRDRADDIFAGGVRQSWLEGGKQFNQNYRLAFLYLKWRQ